MSTENNKRYGYRATVKNGKKTRKFFIVEPPYPRPGDVLEFDGQDWTCTRLKREEILFEFQPDGARLNQIFPPTGATQ